MNAVEIEQAISELASQPFDRAEFAFQFLATFGNKVTTLKRILAYGSSDFPNFVGKTPQCNNIYFAKRASSEVRMPSHIPCESPERFNAENYSGDLVGKASPIRINECRYAQYKLAVGLTGSQSANE